MPIQYRCQDCQRPIEVDDEAAGQMVACPFCREIKPAPTSSDPALLSTVPLATPRTLGPPVDAAAPTPPSAAGNAAANRLGWAALLSAGFAVVCIIVFVAWMLPMMAGLGPAADMAEFQRRMQSELEARPGMAAVSILGSCAAPLVGVVLGIGALLKGASPRWPAIVALCGTGGLLLISCMGFLLQMATGAM